MRTILYLARKEILQVFRDRLMPRMVLVAPVIILLVLANAMTFEVKYTNLVLVDLDHSPSSRSLADGFAASGRFRVVEHTTSMQRAERRMLRGEAGMILRIPRGFHRDLAYGRRPPVQLVLNAEDGAAAGVSQSYALAILRSFSEESARMVAAEAGRVRSASVTIETRKWYNPAGRYRDYMAIGLLAALLTLVGVLMTALNIAREKEIGTLEQLNATPITRGQFILGKLVPFWVLGLIELTIGLVVVRFVFGVAFAGSVGIVFLGASLYLVAALGLGLFISTGASNQQQALFLTYFTLVTFFLMGGIFTPIESMPFWAQRLADLNPIKHFVVVLRGVLLKGATLRDVWVEMAAMLGFALVVIPVALLRYRKTST